MSAVLKLVQGSPEWHTYRATMRNASETPAVLGISPWLTPYGLWLLKTGRSQPTVTQAMAHGTRMEPQARAAYEAHTGQIMNPLVLQECVDALFWLRPRLYSFSGLALLPASTMAPATTLPR